MNMTFNNASSANIERIIYTTDSLPPMRYVIPHLPPMLFMEKRITWERGKGTTSCELKNDTFYMQNNIFKGHWLIEFLAQGIAVIAGTEEAVDNKTTVHSFGFIVSIDKFKIHSVQQLKAGETVIIRVERVFHLHPTSVHNATAFCNEEIIAEGQFKTFLMLEGFKK